MKNLFFYVLFLFPITIFAQEGFDPEIEGNGQLSGKIMTDRTGNQGHYENMGATLSVRHQNLFIGGLLEFQFGEVLCQNQDHLDSKDYLLGIYLLGWGKFSRHLDYTFCLIPGIKRIYNEGQSHDGTRTIQEIWGVHNRGWLYLSDSLNRWFRSQKFLLEFQDNFQLGEENIWLNGNEVTINKNFFRLQCESTVKAVKLRNKTRLEPKLLIGYLWNCDRNLVFLEAGAGVSISFTKEGRYYEPLSLKYTGSYSDRMLSQANSLELSADILALCRLFQKR